MRRTRLGLAAATAATVVLTLAPSASSAPSAAGSDRPVPRDRGAAAQRLRAEATATLATSGSGGVLRFAGVRGRGRIDNPAVGAGTGLEAAARAHLKRYGSAFGTDRAGTSLDVGRTTRSAAGQDVVRFEQLVDDVPVLGGEVVVAMGADRDLSSVSSTLSAAEQVAPPRVSEQAASTVARALVAGRGATATYGVAPQGRAIFDPAVFGEPATEGARSGWRFEVTGPGELHRMVLIDDQTGAPLLDVDENQHIDRVVCDNVYFPHDTDVPCTSGFARTEGGPTSSVTEVNTAYDLAGIVSDFYQQVGGLDLTQLLGIQTSTGGPKLAATVRWCYTDDDCPFYPNAFWNGSQMYYGSGFAGADDVVGHEMTHGVIDQFSQLFYWGQPGAINESIADVMGEIVDHRHASTGDSASDWRLGEDLPVGAIRNLADPATSSLPAEYRQPDRMTSPLYIDDTAYDDNGGVHQNSGVGNKTAYLISQGGTFNGQTITGIDAGDATLAKTAKLYLNLIETLPSGSGYADLAANLEQSCQSLIGTDGFTAADCAAVHAATVATELRTRPTKDPQAGDAPQSCPAGTTSRILFDSEAGTPGWQSSPGGSWIRTDSPTGTGDPVWADAGDFTFDDMNPTAESLTLAAPVTLPAGQTSYLWFQGWYLFDYGPYTATDPYVHYFDAGTVQIDRGDGAGPQPAERLPWVNGPGRFIDNQYGNPAGLRGRTGFGGSSGGWLASRADLSSLAGRPVRPQFTVNYDSFGTYPGWYLDDIRIYTCDRPPAPTAQVIVGSTPHIKGTAKVGKVLRAVPGAWSPAPVTLTYQWLRNGRVITRATRPSYKLTKKDRGKRISVRVTGRKAGYLTAVVASARTKKVR